MPVTHKYLSCAKIHLKRCFQHIFFIFFTSFIFVIGIFGMIYGFDGLWLGIYYFLLVFIGVFWFSIPVCALVSYSISYFCTLTIERKARIFVKLVLFTLICTSISDFLHAIHVLDTKINFDWK